MTFGFLASADARKQNVRNNDHAISVETSELLGQQVLALKNNTMEALEATSRRLSTLEQHYRTFDSNRGKAVEDTLERLSRGALEQATSHQFSALEQQLQGLIRRCLCWR